MRMIGLSSLIQKRPPDADLCIELKIWKCTLLLASPPEMSVLGGRYPSFVGGCSLLFEC